MRKFKGKSKRHWLLCRSKVISIDSITQGEAINNKTSSISGQQLISLSPTPITSVKTQGEYPKPTFCCLVLALRPQHYLDQRTELGHVSRACSLETIELVSPRRTPSYPLPPQMHPVLPGKQESGHESTLCVILLYCNYDRSPWLFMLF